MSQEWWREEFERARGNAKRLTKAEEEMVLVSFCHHDNRYDISHFACLSELKRLVPGVERVLAGRLESVALKIGKLAHGSEFDSDSWEGGFDSGIAEAAFVCRSGGCSTSWKRDNA